MRDDEADINLRGFDDYVVSLGDELRGERATRGKSLLDVQRDLRIKASYIAAIENCDPSVFPNQGFIAGYVRSYARYLKLDPDTVFDRFSAESGFQGVNADLRPRASRSGSTKRIEAGPLKGAEIAPRFSGTVTPHRSGFLETISPSGIASVLVLVLLISGLGYGGWWVLQDIQRVEFAPVEQAPGILAEVDPAPVPNASGPVTETEVAAVATTDRDGQLFNRLYRPQELAIPMMEPRDGPIAAIDPAEIGVLRPAPTLPFPTTETALLPELEDDFVEGPIVTVDAAPPMVELLATRAAWVRVYEADGTVLFEKILEKGERYTVPRDAEQPLLRAGNSGSVYLVVDNQAYGPVGTGTSVAKKVSLASLDVVETLTIAADIDVPVETPVNTADNQ